MWFERMTLEVWFDNYQYEIEYDIGESAVKHLTLEDLNLDLSKVPLRYGHHAGNPHLRERIAEQYPGLSGEQVIVTGGASEAIFALNSAIVKPGDHVIVEHPNYPSLYEIPRSLGCNVDLFHLEYDNMFKPEVDALRELITPETKMISFTHPNNPTGSMISEQELHTLVGLAEEYNLYLMFDETYRDLNFANPLPPAASLSSRVISVSTMSKCYGIPGIRIGWAATKNKQILESLLTVREQISIANNALGEAIAMFVLSNRDEFLSRAKIHIAKNMATVAGWLTDHQHVEWVNPEAGVVGYPRIRSDLAIDPEKLYRTLAEKYKTFVIPGRCFEMDNMHFRLGFGGGHKEIVAGLRNLDQALNEIQ